MKILHYADFTTTFGQMGLVKSKNGICEVLFPEDVPFKDYLTKKYSADIQYNPSVLKNELKQMEDYFAGKLKYFDIKLDLSLPHFYQKVLMEVMRIPYGETASYGDIAARVNNPKAARAVGTANARNPIPIIIPCHRVIAGDGSLGGYGGRLERKMFLLELEGAF